MRARRARWKKYQTRIDPARLLFSPDATWTTTWLPSEVGARGPEARENSDGHWKTMTFLAALRCASYRGPWVSMVQSTARASGPFRSGSGPNAEARPRLVILDNLGSHKGKAVRRALRASGARLLFLPPYSPTQPHRTGLRQTETSMRRPRSEPSTLPGTHLLIARKPSNPANAKTTSETQATLHHETERL